jgi:hypothetical protein
VNSASGCTVIRANRKSDADMKSLIDVHAAFHRSASAVAAMIESGKRAEAEKLIVDPNSDSGHSRRSWLDRADRSGRDHAKGFRTRTLP